MDRGGALLKAAGIALPMVPSLTAAEQRAFAAGGRFRDHHNSRTHHHNSRTYHDHSRAHHHNSRTYHDHGRAHYHDYHNHHDDYASSHDNGRTGVDPEH